MIAKSPIVKHLVLIGGGHSHLNVLKQLGMHPTPGLAVTLISRDIDVPYSGLLPGFISGIYNAQDIYIDLRPLAQFAKTRIIQADIQKIDLNSKEVILPDRPNISFDLLSLNIGSEPIFMDSKSKEIFGRLGKISFLSLRSIFLISA